MHVLQTPDGFDVIAPDGTCLLRHTASEPCIRLAVGSVDFAMTRGNFAISKGEFVPLPLKLHSITKTSEEAWHIEFYGAQNALPYLSLHITQSALEFESHQSEANLLELDLLATPDEAVWGCGMQYSYLNLRGRSFPTWASEPGVGRDQSSWLTQKMNAEGSAGGDYWTTGYPQPTFISSRDYAVHVDSTAYAEFDFSGSGKHTLKLWEVPAHIELFWGNDTSDLVSQLSSRFGPQSSLPDWALEGATIGLKQGEAGFERLERIIAAGAAVTGIWCEDWVGLRETSFGRRLFWNWQPDDQRYPDLKARIADLKARGVRFLGYVNPYLCIDGALFAEAEAKDFFVRRQDSAAIYIVDFGEFECAMVDLTNPDARSWFASRIISEEMIALGMSGWMADFGEYLPTDAKLFDGSDAAKTHNNWPVLWAKVNDEAVSRELPPSELIYFMRSGSAGLPKHAPLVWTGDQSVDFSRHDGIGTALTASLSVGLVGNGHAHSDIGGYTSLHGNVRCEELMMRWAEMATFTPYMRTHEGNRPDNNLQIDSNPHLLDHFAAMTRLHAKLAPYAKMVSQEVFERGLPMQRAMFLHCDDREVQSIQDQYFYGLDLLVAPILEEGATSRQVYVPGDGDWIDLWTCNYIAKGWQTASGPTGLPPVFYRAGSKFAADFRKAATEHLAWHKCWASR